MSNPIKPGFQNCDTCALTHPICGKPTKVKIGYCRTPFVPKFSFNENDLTHTVEIKSLVGESLNQNQEMQKQ